MRIVGVDFSSAPGPKKPIVVASGALDRDRFVLESIARLESLDAYARWLATKDAWVGGFDFPFGLPREFLESDPTLPTTWEASMRWLARTPRPEIVARFRAFMAARPVGEKFAHRGTDRIAGSSPSMKWVNPPVVWMMREGVSRLIDAGVHLPALHDGDPSRVALEAYPGAFARAITRGSYKADSRAKQTAARAAERERIVLAATRGEPLGIRLVAAASDLRRLVDDACGDELDAALCAIEAAHASRLPRYGAPDDVDPLEGFIVGVPARAT